MKSEFLSVEITNTVLCYRALVMQVVRAYIALMTKNHLLC